MSSARLQRAGALTPRDRIWAAIRSFGIPASDGEGGTPFSPVEVAWLAEQPADTTMSYIRALAKAGYVHPVEPPRPFYHSRCELTRCFLVRDIGVDAPRLDANGKPSTKGRGQQQMWNVLRKTRSPIDWRALALEASTEEHPITKTAALKYLRVLSLAGYLTEAQKGGRSGPPTKYLFVRARDTGPRAPALSRDGSVTDSNTDAEMLPAGGYR